ncbi:hypothetical protein, partial [Listeria monocytogenes]|uniref:hypothetical protein n=1 Tax=Listeria monocytogenes TaxID=1639 RepID=UPI002FDC2765
RADMPFDALSVDARDECSLPLAQCCFRWRRAGAFVVARLRKWLRDVLEPDLAGGRLPDASRATIAELLSACLWTEAFVDAASTLPFLQ